MSASTRFFPVLPDMRSCTKSESCSSGGGRCRGESSVASVSWAKEGKMWGRRQENLCEEEEVVGMGAIELQQAREVGGVD